MCYFHQAWSLVQDFSRFCKEYKYMQPINEFISSRYVHFVHVLRLWGLTRHNIYVGKHQPKQLRSKNYAEDLIYIVLLILAFFLTFKYVWSKYVRMGK